MDGAEVSVLKESHKVSLASLLKSHHRNQPLEGQLSDQQLCGFLVPPDLPESNCARPVAVGLLHTPSCRSRFASSLGCQLFPGSLSSSGLSCSLLGAGHVEKQKMYIYLLL